MKALKAFDYSRDGFTTKHLEPGDDASDVPEACLPGLRAEGFIGQGAPEAKVIEAAPEVGGAVEQPADGLLSPPLEGDGSGETLSAFDHDGDGKPGGSPKGGNRKRGKDDAK